MALERWDPFSDMTRFREAMDRMLVEAFPRPWRLISRVGYALPVDVCEMDDEFLVRAAVPGVRPEDLDITVKEDTLTIRGEIKAPEWMRQEERPSVEQQATGQARQPSGAARGRAECWLQEIPYGRFTRSVALPSPVNASNARAEFENGLLILHLPKAEEARPRRIQIQHGAQRQQIPTGQAQPSGQRQAPP